MRKLKFTIALFSLGALTSGAAFAQDLFSSESLPSSVAPLFVEVEQPSKNFDAGREAENLKRQLTELEAAMATKRSQLQYQLRRAEIQRAAAQSQLATNAEHWHSFTQNSNKVAAERWLIGVQVLPVDDTDGVGVGKVVEKSPAGKAGLRAGDVIESVNDIEVNEVASLNAIIGAAGDQELRFGIKRDTEIVEVPITPMQNILNSTVRDSESSVARHPEIIWQTDRSQLGRATSLLSKARPDAANPREIDELKASVTELRELVQQLTESVGSIQIESLTGPADRDAEDTDDGSEFEE